MQGLIDGPGNEVTTLIAAVYVLEQLLRRHDKVLVHCHAGHSRAPTVVGTYLASRNGYEANNFAKAMHEIKHKRPKVKINAALPSLAITALLKVR